MTELDQRLAQLPDPLPSLLEQAIAISSEVARISEDGSFDTAIEEREDAAWQAALSAAGFSKSEGFVQRVIPLVDELSELQRAVVELLAHIPGVPLNEWPIYAAAWLRRRWLGIDPAGLLFDEIDYEGRSLPLIYVLRELLRSDREEEAKNMVAAIDLPERFELLIDFSLADLDIELFDMSELVENATLELADLEPSESVRGWAMPLVDRLLATFEQPFAVGERPHGDMPELIARMALTSLLAAGITLEPRHDALLRLGWGDSEALALRSIAAIPEPRREAAVLAALEIGRAHV